MNPTEMMEYAIDLANDAKALLNSHCDRLHKEAAVDALVEATTIYIACTDSNDPNWRRTKLRGGMRVCEVSHESHYELCGVNAGADWIVDGACRGVIPSRDCGEVVPAPGLSAVDDASDAHGGACVAWALAVLQRPSRIGQ